MLVNREREKLINAIIYFAQHTRYLGKIKLFKLLYLLDFEHFRMTGRSVTGLNYDAWKWGPVPTALYQEWDDPDPDLEAAIEIKPEQIIDHVRETVEARSKFDHSAFTPRELQIMSRLADQYRDACSPKMIDVAHAENGAWHKVWDGGKGQNRRIEYKLSIADTDPNRDAILEAANEYEAMAAAQEG